MPELKNQEQKKKTLRVALVHDFLRGVGGAEKTLAVLAEMFPHAPIHTLLYEKERMHGLLAGRTIHTSFLQKFPRFLRRRPWLLLPLLPTAPETFNLRAYDLVISSSGAWTKGIVTNLNTTHIAYVHSPMRFVWDYNERYVRERGRSVGWFTRLLLSYLRLWDHAAAKRPDVLIANSDYTKERIQKYYRRDAEVIYPPIRINDREKVADKKRTHFLVVSRLSAYKKIDIIIRACNKLKLPLVIIGEGREKKRLAAIAGATVRIVGWQSEEKLAQYYRTARATIFLSDDDFGMVAAESLAHGTPVIAYGAGGAREIVADGTTGILCSAQTRTALEDGLQRFIVRERFFDRKVLIEHAQKFSRERFVEAVQRTVDSRLRITT